MSMTARDYSQSRSRQAKLQRDGLQLRNPNATGTSSSARSAMHKKWRGQLGEAAKRGGPYGHCGRNSFTTSSHDKSGLRSRLARSSMILSAIIALASSSLSASRRAMQAISNATPMTRRVSGSYATPFNSMAQFPCLTCSILDTWGSDCYQPPRHPFRLVSVPDGRTNGPFFNYSFRPPIILVQFPPASRHRRRRRSSAVWPIADVSGKMYFGYLIGIVGTELIATGTYCAD